MLMLYYPYARDSKNPRVFKRLGQCGDLVQADCKIRNTIFRSGCKAKLYRSGNKNKWFLLDSCTNKIYGYIEREELCEMKMKTHKRS